MLPPSHKRRWTCTTCRIELGRMHLSETQGMRLFATSAVINARKTGKRTWILTCEAGHETEWCGDQLNWIAVPRAA